MYANTLSGYASALFKYNKIDFYLSGNVSSTDYQREGLYENEANIGNSYGKGEKLTFTGFGAKGGLTYKITGKHLLDVNAGYIQRAPSLRNTFTNSRTNHDVIGISNNVSITGEDLIEEKITAFDASYIFRSPIVKARLTGFYIKTADANEVSFYYADGVQGFVDNQTELSVDTEFVSETVTRY